MNGKGRIATPQVAKSRRSLNVKTKRSHGGLFGSEQRKNVQKPRKEDIETSTEKGPKTPVMNGKGRIATPQVAKSRGALQRVKTKRSNGGRFGSEQRKNVQKPRKEDIETSTEKGPKTPVMNGKGRIATPQVAIVF